MESGANCSFVLTGEYLESIQTLHLAAGQNQVDTPAISLDPPLHATPTLA
jgi:hypothetical protein